MPRSSSAEPPGTVVAARPPLAVTMGCPAGIGPDISLAAWLHRKERDLPAFVCFADARVLFERARGLGLDVPIQEVGTSAEAGGVFRRALPVRNVTCAAAVVPGRPDGANSGATIASIEAAVAEVEAGHACAVVTNPIAKSVLYAAGFSHPGHTELLAALAERAHPGRQFPPVMMLACDALKVVPLTIHIPLTAVARSISRERICGTLATMRAALIRDFGIPSPRIAVTGLNPHAGEQGAIGSEERDIIAPAIAEAKAGGLDVTGPHSADALFHAGARRTYDAVLAMYHDQALIPIKTLAFDESVNVTLGLPFVRTSPDHGTAFDIAGTGGASAESFIAALRLAASMASRRAAAP